MTEAKNPLIKLRKAHNMTCYNGYISEMERWATREQFVLSCVKHESIWWAKVTPKRSRRIIKITKLSREAWDWWFQVKE